MSMAFEEPLAKEASLPSVEGESWVHLWRSCNFLPSKEPGLFFFLLKENYVKEGNALV